MERSKMVNILVICILMIALSPERTWADDEKTALSINYKPLSSKVFYAGADQFYEEDGSGPFYNEEEALQAGDILTAIFSDHEEVYEVQIDKDGLPLLVSQQSGESVPYDRWCVTSDQNKENLWSKGKHQITLNFMGAEAQINVTVQDNPVLYIEFELAGENIFFSEDVAQTIDTEEGSFTFYDIYTNRGEDFFADGDTITLKFADPVKGKIAYCYDTERGGFFSSSGNEIPYRVFYDDYYGQYEEHWKVGDNPQWIYCCGYAAEVPITILTKDSGWVTRVAGADRYDTAIAIANRYKEITGTERFCAVVLASGDNFPDALSGSYLAYKKNAPILITSSKNENDTKINRYLLNNMEKGCTVYVLGGELAVSENMIKSLRDAGCRIVRLAGKDRYGTNLAVLREAGIENGNTILVASGTRFADSLSASALPEPILLVGNSLTAEQISFVTTQANRDFCILGGEFAVRSAVESDIRVLLNGKGVQPEIRRVAGANRYKTSIEIARTFFSSKSPEQVVTAYGELYPDGLCGGPLAAKAGYPLILTGRGAAEDAAAYTQDREIKNGTVLGGNYWMTNEVVRNVYHLVSDVQIQNYE